MIPRATAKEHHDKVVDAICDNLDIIYKENIFDDINFMTEKEIIYIVSKTEYLPYRLKKASCSGCGLKMKSVHTRK